MPVVEVLKQKADGNSAYIKLKDGAIYYSFSQKEQFLTHIAKRKKKKEEKTQLGTIMGTSARMQSSGFIPLNFQRVMQSFTYVTQKSKEPC